MLPFMLGAKSCKTGQSFMFTRPLDHNVFAFAERYYQMAFEEDWSSTYRMQAIVAGQKTVGSSTQAPGYFLINCQPTIRIAGDTSPDATTRDVRAEWLNLPSDFSGLASVNPQQKQVGTILTVERSLKGMLDWTFLEGWWVRMNMPIMAVENNLQLTQHEVSGSGGAPNDIISAFDQDTWKAGKMVNRSMSHTALGSINLALGSTWWHSENFVLSTYSGVSIPVSSKQSPEYIFSPFVGPNGHLAIDFGVIAELPIAVSCRWNTKLFLNVENHYYIENHQMRILELHDKPWSRYLQVRQEGSPLTTQAVNVLTQCVKVRPFNAVDLATGLSLEAYGWQFSLGYGLWARNTEELELTPPACETAHYSFEKYGIAGTGSASASKSTISEQAANDGEFITIKPSDIDLCTSGSRGGMSQRVLAAASYLWEGSRHHMVFDIGGYYEFPRTNVTLRQWGLWGKVAVSF